MKRLLLISALFFLLLPIAMANTLSDALREAKEKNLAADPYWETLLHFKHGIFSYRSLIDDPRFFLSANGKEDKEAELYATLNAMFKVTEVEDEHAQCRFPARWSFLKERLDSLKNEELFAANCPKLEQAAENLKPQKMVLVFSAASFGAPATMFGHTLIRFDKEGAPAILGGAVTYAAWGYEGDSPIFYSIKGLIGGYDGAYTVTPYTKKITEYSLHESRDLWEYELNFTEEEVYRAFLHVWEMSLVTSEYYFLDENCSYNILFFLDTAREGLTTTEGYGAFVAPADTVRRVRESRVIKSIRYRPPNIRRALAVAETLSSGALKLSRSVSRGEAPANSVKDGVFPAREQIAVLDLAGELAKEHFNGADEDEAAFYKKVSFDIAKTRAEYDTVNDYPTPAPPYAPDEGHRIGRLSLGGGYASELYSYARLEHRFAYHGPTDSERGYEIGNYVESLKTAVRYYPAPNLWKYEGTEILNIGALSSANALRTPLSWRYKMGLKDRLLYEEERYITPYIRADGGITLGGGKAIFYLLAAGEAAGHSSERRYIYGGAGGAAGVILAGEFIKLQLSGEYLRFSRFRNDYETKGEGSVSLYPALNHRIGLNMVWQKSAGKEDTFDTSLIYSYHY